MKKSKKFVLAALALLAITGLLALSGCKNDSVPEPTRYTVKFDKGDNSEYTGDLPADITVVSGTKLTAEQLKGLDSTDNYIFEGWYDGENKAEGGTYTVTKDVTLVAKWRDRGTVASVTFSPAGDTKFYCDESIAVSLTSEEGATIQYHLGDGSWKAYTEDTTISITGDTTITTITAKATKDGLKPSAETTATYTVRKLEGITVTPPARTVYSVGEEVVHQKDEKIEVTATYDDEEERTVTGTITTDTSTLTQSAGIGKTVTVSYTEGETPKTTTFTVTVFPAEVKVLTGYTSPNNTDDSWTYVEFGEWPQTILKGDVTVYEDKSKEMGMFTYYLGSDGNYYVKVTAKPYEDTYTYSDGNPVEEDEVVYFKVEPIVWRVLNKDYASTGKALLLAESILTGGIKWADSSNNYMQSYIRQWLNGNSGTEETSDYGGDAGFLQTAFAQSARKLIADTTVDNTAASTTDAGNNLPQATDYACANTTDKIFLLSEKEATNSEYGFAAYDAYGKGSTRIRVTTDYAEATEAYQSLTEGYGGWWWLRSPYYDLVYNGFIVRGIFDNGIADNYSSVFNTEGGVVPALSISLQ